MKNYPHVLSRIFNTPLMVQPAKARAIVGALAAHIGMPARPAIDDLPPEIFGVVPGRRHDMAKPYAVTDRAIGVISAVGTLVHNAASAAPPSGMTCYDQVELRLEDAVTDPAIRGVLIDIDSPGGEASESAFKLAERIREMRSIKPIWAVADEMACSAAYLIGAAASRFFCPPLGYCGSIGVYALHLDMSEFDKKQGLTWTYIVAGAHKVDGNPHAPLGADIQAEIQADVDTTYARFIASVARSRPALGIKGARATEARYYRGADAVKLGLADDTLDFRGALEQLTKQLDRPQASLNRLAARRAAALPDKPCDDPPEDADRDDETDTEQPAASAAGQPGNGEEMTMPDPTKPGASAPAPAAESTAAATPATAPAAATTPAAGATAAAPATGGVVSLDAARSEGEAAAAKRASEVAQLCQLAGRPDLIAGFLEQKVSVDQVRAKLLEAKAQAGEQAQIATGHVPGAGGSSADIQRGWDSAFAKVTGRTAS